jgi:uncharacterized protein involved in exopolysaccharide biosynthesis
MTELPAGDSVTLADITAVLARRKWQIATAFFLVIALVAGVTFTTPKQYESHMKILVKNERADTIVSAGNGEGSGYHGEVSETEINSEIELLNSSTLLRRVVTACGLDRLDKASAGSSDRMAVALERATQRLQRDLNISPVRKANVIQVDYSARDPRQAAAVLRQLAEYYLEEHLKVHGTPGSYRFFADQTENYRNELKQAETRLTDFRRAHDIVMLTQQKDAMLQKASDSEAALFQADATIGEYTGKSAITSAQLDAATPRILTQDRVAPNQFSADHLSAMLVDLQNRRTGLLAKFRPDDRLVLETEQEIADTRAALEKAIQTRSSEQSTDINPIHQALEMDMAKQQSELAGVKARREALAQHTQLYRSQLMALGNATAEYDDLMRSQTEAEQNYLLYAKKTEEARIAESLDRQKIANVAIAEPPLEPHLASKPNVRLNLTLGVILAAFLSVGLAFGLEYLQQPPQRLQFAAQAALPAGSRTDAIEEPAGLETLTGLPILATIFVSRQVSE